MRLRMNVATDDYEQGEVVEVEKRTAIRLIGHGMAQRAPEDETEARPPAVAWPGIEEQTDEPQREPEPNEYLFAQGDE